MSKEAKEARESKDTAASGSQTYISIEKYLRDKPDCVGNELLRRTVLVQGRIHGLQTTQFWENFIKQYL